MRAWTALILATVGASSAAWAATPDALGTLTTRSGVTVTNASGVMEVPASSQAYYAGEGISTGAAGSAVITLDDGALELGPATRVRVVVQPRGYRIHLEAGGVKLRYGARRAFEVVAGSVRARSSGAAAGAAAVALGGDGAVLVRSERGPMVVQARDGVAPVALTPGSVRRFDADVPPGTPPVGAGDATRGAGWRWAAGSMGFAATGATAWGVKELVEDDGDDEELASPVR